MFDMWISSGAAFSISRTNGLKHQKAMDVIYEKKSENKKKKQEAFPYTIPTE